MAMLRVQLAGTSDYTDRRRIEGMLTGEILWALCGEPSVTPKVIKAAEAQLALLTEKTNQKQDDQTGEQHMRCLNRWLTGPCRSGR